MNESRWVWVSSIAAVVGITITTLHIWAIGGSWERHLLGVAMGIVLTVNYINLQKLRAEKELIESGRGGPVMPPDDDPDYTPVDEPNVYVGEAAKRTKRISR